MNKHSLASYKIILILTYIAILASHAKVFAEELYSDPSHRFTIVVSDKQIDDNSLSTLRNMLPNIIHKFESIYKELERIFQHEIKTPITIRFMHPESYKNHTKSPNWTSAIFYKGEITIPLSPKTLKSKVLIDSMRHEYAHAFIHDMSKGHCSAWLDEGLAQWIEGSPNPKLGPALRKWIKSYNAFPLLWLKNDFTALDPSLVPTAYAVSFFATKVLIRRNGFSSIRKYLKDMSEEKSRKNAFSRNFGLSIEEFSKSITPQIKLWAQGNNRHP